MKETKIKIAHIITRMDWGGSPDIIRMICEKTQDKYDTTLIIGESNYQTLTTKKFLADFKGKVIYLHQLRREINPFWDICAFLKLIHIFISNQFDIVHTHTSKAGFIGPIAAKICKVKKIVHTPHGHIYYGYFSPWITKIFIAMERFAARFPDWILTLTCLEKNDMLKIKITDNKKIKVIPPGIDTTTLPKFDKVEREKKRRIMGITDNDLLVVAVARLEEVKGLKYFIEAAAACHNNSLRFVIAGEGKLRKNLETLAHNTNAAIEFLGWRTDAAEIIAAADIMVQPSLNEAMALSILQAQFLHTPVIASRTGGIPEIIADDITGILTKPADSAQIAMAIKKLAASSEERKRLSDNAYLQAENYFTLDKMIESLEIIYNS